MRSKPISIIIGLVFPYLSVMAGIYYFRFSTDFILGFPPLYFWLFSWFILVSICLSISWAIDSKAFLEK